MSRANPMIIAVVALATLGGCTTVRYPMLPAWSSAEGQAMTCEQLRVEMDNARRTQVQIEDIASGRDQGARPRLYSMARPDADRAVQARIAEIENLRQTKRCSA